MICTFVIKRRPIWPVEYSNTAGSDDDNEGEDTDEDKDGDEGKYDVKGEHHMEGVN